MVRPKKHLGQHFLTDQNIAQRITGSLIPGGSANLIEVGPGKGILTQYLLREPGFNLVPVEIDSESVEYLITNFPDLKSKLIEGDFLRFDPGKVFGKDEKFRIIGNFPYNISSQIFFKVLDHREQVSEVVCMIQKEVAERLSTPPGSKTYGILSVLLQTWYNIEYLFSVHPGSFFPRPDVQSAVIRLTRNGRKELGVDPARFKTVVKASFNQRRKMIRNSVKGIVKGELPDSRLLQMRPEQLTVEEFIELTTILG
jgi:16S rRNA (adenine1518-N6/adenine1519-N6)-dimethyltransferase